MPKPRVIEIRFPSMGVIRRQAQERAVSAVSYPTPYAVNVRLEDSLTNRLRGGSFTAIDAGDRPSEIIYQDRLLTFSDNLVKMSRAGDHSDYDYSKDVSDVFRATRIQFSEAGEVGEDVVALIPHKDAFLLGFTSSETWIHQGNPFGPRRNVSRDVGIVGADAWCKNHDTVYFLSSHGLYSIGADGGGLTPLSEDRVPEDLTNVDDSDCTLTYNHADRGVYIHLSSGVSWFYDTAREGFWPFDADTTDSYVLIGPLRIGGPNQRGMIQTLHGVMAAGSASVRWRIVPGDTAEEANDNGKAAITAALAGNDFEQYYAASGAWNAGRSHTAWPRVRTAWAVIMLNSSGSWAYESLLLETIPFGRHR
jgi:hypothetical protein